MDQGQNKGSETNRRQADGVFNLTIDEVRMIVRYRTLSPHQQRGVSQAMEVIRPSLASRSARPPRGT